VALGLQTLQLAALTALALAAALGLRRWRRTAEPGLVAGPVLLGFLIAAQQLPASLSLVPLPSLGPAPADLQLRWTTVLLLGAGVVAVGLTDPATARSGSPPAEASGR
jgi:uncharacterized protein involved in response to NO